MGLHPFRAHLNHSLATGPIFGVHLSATAGLPRGGAGVDPIIRAISDNKASIRAVSHATWQTSPADSANNDLRQVQQYPPVVQTLGSGRHNNTLRQVQQYPPASQHYPPVGTTIPAGWINNTLRSANAPPAARTLPSGRYNNALRWLQHCGFGRKDGFSGFPTGGGSLFSDIFQVILSFFYLSDCHPPENRHLPDCYSNNTPQP